MKGLEIKLQDTAKIVKELGELCTYRGNTDWVTRPKYNCGKCLGQNKECTAYTPEKPYGNNNL